MNRTQAKECEGKSVKWDWWGFTENYAPMCAGTMLHSKDVVGSIWIMNKLTKGGMCVISRHGSKETISIAPCYLSPYEEPK